MPSHARRRLALALGCLPRRRLAGATALPREKGPRSARDWKTHPAIVEIDTKHDVYALGDVHGDYDRLVTLLVAAKIIQKDPPLPKRRAGPRAGRSWCARAT